MCSLDQYSDNELWTEIRKRVSTKGPKLRKGSLSVYLSNLTWHGVTKKLSPTSIDVVMLLMAASPGAVTMDSMIETLGTNRQCIHNAILKIRDAFPGLIEYHSKCGYNIPPSIFEEEMSATA